MLIVASAKRKKKGDTDLGFWGEDRLYDADELPGAQPDKGAPGKALPASLLDEMAGEGGTDEPVNE